MRMISIIEMQYRDGVRPKLENMTSEQTVTTKKLKMSNLKEYYDP